MTEGVSFLNHLREQDHAFALRASICHATAGLVSDETNPLARLRAGEGTNANPLDEKISAGKIFAETKKEIA